MNLAYNTTNLAQDGPKMAQDGPNLEPNWSCDRFFEAVLGPLWTVPSKYRLSHKLHGSLGWLPKFPRFFADFTISYWKTMKITEARRGTRVFCGKIGIDSVLSKVVPRRLQKTCRGSNWAPSWGHLGPSWAILGPSWAILGPSWAILGRLGAILTHLGAILKTRAFKIAPASRDRAAAPPK